MSFLENFKCILKKQIDIKSVSNPKENNGIYQLTFKGKDDVKQIAEFLYKDSTICLSRKFEIIERFIK